jgi:uncharacterized protein with PQ loop repeat
MHEFALFAGSAAAAIFMISQLPMLIKAYRTKDLTSYSFANIGLANFGNVLYTVYLFQVPIGPAWAIHGFNLSTTGLMLFLYLRHCWRAPAGSAPAQGPEPSVQGGGWSGTETGELDGGPDPKIAVSCSVRSTSDSW